MRTIYLAGPMRGYPAFNFPAFDAAAQRLREQGYTVVSPADMDRAEGFDPYSDQPNKVFMRNAILRDLDEIAHCDAIAVLPGWEKSSGCAVELKLAEFLKLPIFNADAVPKRCAAGVSA